MRKLEDRGWAEMRRGDKVLISADQRVAGQLLRSTVSDIYLQSSLYSSLILSNSYPVWMAVSGKWVSLALTINGILSYITNIIITWFNAQCSMEFGNETLVKTRRYGK
jgi:hypothetical protein